MLALFLAISFGIASANAAPPVDLLPGAEKVGQARMSVLFWDAYDAHLYAPKRQVSFDEPFLLELHYLLEIDGKDIAERSAEEIRKLGFDDEVKLAAWYSQMQAIFPDVQEGSQLVGLYQPEQATAFYQDGEKLGTVRDPEFGRWFFGIWLHENTSDPAFRKELLGLK
jgi:hypothetical protein